MPRIYLSPSTQEFNQFVNGGNEEQYMNLIVDAMIPVLQQNGIEFGRNTPDMTAGSSIRQSNAGNYDFHLAVHSNASGEAQAGQNRGSIMFYYPGSANGQRMAEILQRNFREIYPLPDLVRTVTTTNLGEVSQTRAPAVLIEVAYHDNIEDANWIKNNIDLIGQTIARSVVEYFNTSGETNTPTAPSSNTGRVTLTSGYLNIRREPSLNAPVIGMAPNGATVNILNKVGDWYHINFQGTNGYVFGQYIRLL
jgi:N-acetylmuramoyl-L-alanine amidase